MERLLLNLQARLIINRLPLLTGTKNLTD